MKLMSTLNALVFFDRTLTKHLSRPPPFYFKLLIYPLVLISLFIQSRPNYNHHIPRTMSQYTEFFFDRLE